MKKLFVLLLVISACSFSVNYDISSLNPNEYGLSTELSGRLFKISCNSVQFSARYVDDECKRYMSEFAYTNGYDYFSVTEGKASSSKSSHSYVTTQPITTVYHSGHGPRHHAVTYVPTTQNYTITNNSQYYYFVLITAEEVSNWENYYKVADYFPDGYEI